MSDNQFLTKVGKKIRELRVARGLSQEEFADQCGLHRTYVGGIERAERNITVCKLNTILTSLGCSWHDFSVSLGDECDCGQSGALPLLGKASLHIRFFNSVSIDEFTRVEKYMRESVNQPGLKARDVIAQALKMSIRQWPDENISDIWHHCIYRIYLETKIGTDPEQSWVRTSGEGFELFFEDTYNPYLFSSGIRLRSLIRMRDKLDAISSLELEGQVGSSKIDIVVEKRFPLKKEDSEKWSIVGAIHSKVSLAERVSDDIPASRILMEKGIESILITLDVKSFPPPNGDLINRGELGRPDKPSDKRKYIEDHGDFSACFSYNKRTMSSEATTISGKRIVTISKTNKDDAFVKYLIERFVD